MIEQKNQDDIIKMNGGKTSQNIEVDYTKRIDNIFAKKMAYLIVVRSHLEKYGYSKYWSTWDLVDLYDSYAILKCRNYE